MSFFKNLFSSIIRVIEDVIDRAVDGPDGLAYTTEEDGSFRIPLSDLTWGVGPRRGGRTPEFEQPENGTLELSGNGRALIYTPDPDFSGTDTFTFVRKFFNTENTVSIEVTPVNDAPVGADDVASAEAGESVTVDVLANDTDVDNAPSELTIEVESIPAGLDVTVDNGQLVVDAKADTPAGDYAITYRVVDSEGAKSELTTVTVAVTAPEPPEPQTLEGNGQDGYIAGATVWADTDGDGVLDPGEASGTTDASGNFSISGGTLTGTLYLQGGTDIATLLPFDGTLKAPEGSTVITPLTTLVVAVLEADAAVGGTLSVAEAETIVKATLGIDQAVELGSFDPIAVLSDPTADSDALAEAEAVFAAGAQVLNTAKVAGAGVSGASGGTVDAAAGQQAALAAIADQVLAAGSQSQTVVLTDSQVVATLVDDTASKTGVDPADVDGDLDAVVQASNQQISEVVNDPDVLDPLTEVTRVSAVAQGETTAAVSDGDVSAEETQQFTTDLEAEVADTPVGDVDGAANSDPTTPPEDEENFQLGTAGDDTLTGTIGLDRIFGQGGDDTVVALGGRENLYDGGDGFDSLDYSALASVNVNLATGTVVANDGSQVGTDTVSNFEKIIGTAGNDTMVGSDDPNQVERFEGRGGNDDIDGGAGLNDGIDHRASDTGQGIIADLSNNVVFDEFGGTDQVSNIERVYGTIYDDVITGDVNDNQFIGERGDDDIDGGDGFDSLFSNGTETESVIMDLSTGVVTNDGFGFGGTVANIEQVFGASFNDDITGDANNNELFGLEGDDQLFGLAGDDLIVGNAGADFLSGGDGDDVVVAGIGDDAGDTLVDGLGADFLEGGAGADTFVIEGGSGVNQNDTIGDFEVGADVIDLTTLPNFIAPAFIQAQLDAAAQADSDNGFDGGTFIQLGPDSNLFVSHDDSATSLTLADFVLPTPDPGVVLNGQDISGDVDDDFDPDPALDRVLRGGSGDDQIFGLEGDDQLEGFAGDDTLDGGPGNDLINPGQGNDSVDGGTGGGDTLAFADFEYLSANGVSVNLSAEVWDGLNAGEARDPDGGIDSIVGIEGVSGTEYDDRVRIGDAATTGIDGVDFNNGEPFFTVDGRGGNDTVEAFGDVYTLFSPGQSEFFQDEFGNDDPFAGNYFFTNGQGHLELGEGQFGEGTEGEGVQVFYEYAQFDQDGNFLNQDLNLALGPNSRTFFDDGVSYVGLTNNADEINGNNTSNAYFDLRGGMDTVRTGGADRGINMGDTGDTSANPSGGDGAADVVFHQGGNINIDSFEVGVDQVDFSEFPVAITAAFLQGQLDQMIANGAPDVFFDFGQNGSLFLPLDPNTLDIGRDFVVPAAPTVGTTATATEGDDFFDFGSVPEPTEGPDVANLLGGNDSANVRGGDDVVNLGAGDDSVRPGSGSDTLDGGEGGDNLDYFSDQFLSSQGVVVNATGSAQDVGFAVLAAGTVLDPDGGVDSFTSFESFGGGTYSDQFFIGNGADTGMTLDPNSNSYVININGNEDNDSVSPGSDGVSDVYVIFAPGQSEFFQDEFGNDDPFAGNYFFTGQVGGHLEMGEGQFGEGTEGEGVQVFYQYAQFDQDGNFLNQDLNLAFGPNSRTFFDDGVSFVGLTNNADEINGNDTSNAYFDLRGGADVARTGGADRGINLGDDGSGGDGATDVVFHQGGAINIDSFEVGVDQVDFSEFPVAITAAFLQGQLDQMITDGASDVFFDFGQFGSLYLPLDPNTLDIGRDFVLPTPDPGVVLNGQDINGDVDDDFDPDPLLDRVLRGGSGDDQISGLEGDDQLEGFAGDDTLDGGPGNDLINPGQGNDSVDGGTGGGDTLAFADFEYLSANGVSVNLSAEVWDGLTTGEARDPDGGIDSVVSIEGVSGTEYDDRVRIGDAATTGIDGVDFNNGEPFFSVDGRGGNDTVEVVGDVYTLFSPGQSEFFQDEFGNDDPFAGNYFFTNGQGHLELGEGQFGEGTESEGVQVFYEYEQFDQDGNSLGQDLNLAFGPNSRTFFDDGVSYIGLTNNADEINGNNTSNAYFDARGGADTVRTGGADRGINLGDTGDTSVNPSGGDGAADVVFHQGGAINIDSFEVGLDKVDLSEVVNQGLFLTAAQLQSQLDAQDPSDGTTFIELGNFGSISLDVDAQVTDFEGLATPADPVVVDLPGAGDQVFDNGTEILGDTGDDILYGRDGIDDIIGDQGDDLLVGGSGEDYLTPGAGNDTIFGGDDVADGVDDGPDTDQDFVFYNDSEFQSTNGFYVNLSDGIRPFFGQDWQPGTVVDADGGIDTLVGIEWVETASGDDFFNTGGVEGLSVIGGDGDDTFFNDGPNFTNILPGFAGPNGNLISASNGEVEVNFAEFQFDTFDENGPLSITSGAQIFLPGDDGQGNAFDGSADLFQGGAFTVLQGLVARAAGTNFDDELYGSNFDNFLAGQAGADQFFTGGGNDNLFLGFAADGSGLDGDADTVFFQGGGNTNILELEQGVDKVDVSEVVNQGLFLTAAQLQSQLDAQDPNDGTTFIELGNFGSISLDVDAQVTDFEGLATPADPVVVDLPGAGDQVFDNGTEILGDTGDDILYGRDGIDDIIGDQGDDLLVGGSGEDYLTPGAGNDTIFGGDDVADGVDDGPDTDQDFVFYNDSEFQSTNGFYVNLTDGTRPFFGQDWQPGTVVDADGGIDTLVGIEWVETASGDDFFNTGGVEGLSVIGGDGDDTFFNDGPNFTNILPGRAGTNGNLIDATWGGVNLDFADFQFDTFDENGVTSITSGAYIFLPGDDGQGNPVDGSADLFEGGAFTVLRGNVTSASGTQFGDEFYGSNFNNSFAGGEGDDYAQAGPGNNTYDLGEDFDIIDFRLAPEGIVLDLNQGGTNPGANGFGGTDAISGAERIIGTPHADNITGMDDAAIQRFILGPGNDTLEGGSGVNDGVDYRDGFSSPFGTPSTGILANLVTGIIEDGFGTQDTVSGVERVFGSSLGDEIIGDGADNLFLGEAGNDTLTGGGGDDLLFGGEGADTFAYQLNPIDGSLNSGNDSIGDFTVGVDTLQLDDLLVDDFQIVDGAGDGNVDDALLTLNDGSTILLNGVGTIEQSDLDINII